MAQLPTRLLTPEQFLALSPNKRLLAVKEQIEFEREHWDQGPVWHVVHDQKNAWCGSTFCTAGMALFLAGDLTFDASGEATLAGPVHFDGGLVTGWRARAEELLGLSKKQARLFFTDKEDWPEAIDRILAANAEG
jgi:hypothetical protein